MECREIPEHFPSAKWYIDDTRSHRIPGAQLWIGSSRKWSVFGGSPYHVAQRKGSLSMESVVSTLLCSTDALPVFIFIDVMLCCGYANGNIVQCTHLRLCV